MEIYLTIRLKEKRTVKTTSKLLKHSDIIKHVDVTEE